MKGREGNFEKISDIFWKRNCFTIRWDSKEMDNENETFCGDFEIIDG